jgi:acyl-CoA thioesterase FadM
MNLYLRLLRVWLTNLGREELPYTHPVESDFRVWPHDLDAFGHMNNGRYLQIMDVARTEWMMRTGVVAAIRRQRWSPLLGGGFIRFRYSLRILQSYRVRTRVLCWDHRWFFLEHAFIDESGRCAAVGVTRAGLRARGKWVPTCRVAESVYPGAESPAIPAYVHDWLGLENQMFETGASETAGLAQVVAGEGTAS